MNQPKQNNFIANSSASNISNIVKKLLKFNLILTLLLILVFAGAGLGIIEIPGADAGVMFPFFILVDPVLVLFAIVLVIVLIKGHYSDNGFWRSIQRIFFSLGSILIYLLTIGLILNFI